MIFLCRIDVRNITKLVKNDGLGNVIENILHLTKSGLNLDVRALFKSSICGHEAAMTIVLLYRISSIATFFIVLN